MNLLNTHFGLHRGLLSCFAFFSNVTLPFTYLEKFLVFELRTSWDFNFQFRFLYGFELGLQLANPSHSSYALLCGSCLSLWLITT